MDLCSQYMRPQRHRRVRTRRAAKLDQTSRKPRQKELETALPPLAYLPEPFAHKLFDRKQTTSRQIHVTFRGFGGPQKGKLR